MGVLPRVLIPAARDSDLVPRQAGAGRMTGLDCDRLLKILESIP